MSTRNKPVKREETRADVHNAQVKSTSYTRTTTERDNRSKSTSKNNDPEVINDLSQGRRRYFSRNGHGSYNGL